MTCVRGAGDPLYADIAVRDAINAGRYLGPRIVAPGTGITVPNGHGAGLFAQVATTPQQASDYVCDLFSHLFFTPITVHKLLHDYYPHRQTRHRRIPNAAHRPLHTQWYRHRA